MKKVTILFLLIPLLVKSQDSTVTNLQLRARTIKILAIIAKESNDTSMVKTFIAWNIVFKNDNPADNANVTISEAKTVDVAKMYETLLALPTGLNETEDFAGDFKTSIQSKRNGNTLLDSLCTAIETSFTNLLNSLKIKGSQFLRLQ